jgi:hypothetical protein
LRLTFAGTGLLGSLMNIVLEELHEELEDVGGDGPGVHIQVDDSQKNS